MRFPRRWSTRPISFLRDATNIEQSRRELHCFCPPCAREPELLSGMAPAMSAHPGKRLAFLVDLGCSLHRRDGTYTRSYCAFRKHHTDYSHASRSKEKCADSPYSLRGLPQQCAGQLTGRTPSLATDRSDGAEESSIRTALISTNDHFPPVADRSEVSLCLIGRNQAHYSTIGNLWW